MRRNLFWLADEQWQQIAPSPTDVRGRTGSMTGELLAASFISQRTGAIARRSTARTRRSTIVVL